MMYLKKIYTLRINVLKFINYSSKFLSTISKHSCDKICVAGQEFLKDDMTNLTPKILSRVGRNLHLKQHHPLGHLQRRITQFIYKRYLTPRGNPLFSVYNQLSPIVSTIQNFDSLLVPKNHVTRQKRDNYYINEAYMLRAHTTAHQAELIRMGLDSFIVFGDVYRRDEIDSSHYPIFHQADAVRLFSKQDVFSNAQDISNYSLFENKIPSETNQGCHSDEAVKILTQDLQNCLLSLAISIFGKDVEWRWVEAYFPFTHPSWEFEVKFGDKWVEMLGCGIMKQEILHNSGASDKIGWAFGLGLERWAMKLYQIPDIRIFWSEDQRFLNQFKFDNSNTSVTFQPFSNHPPCINDISFWLPPNDEYASEDFYDLVRSIGEDIVEKVELIDNFTHPKKGLTSHCYRVTYRSWERALTQDEVTEVNNIIKKEAHSKFGVQIR